MTRKFVQDSCAQFIYSLFVCTEKERKKERNTHREREREREKKVIDS